MEQKQASFDGWAIIEVMGHQRFAGYVTTEAYGAAVLFRIDVPELPERERELGRPQYIDGNYYDKGAKVREPFVAGYSKLIGAGSIYAITPCTEEAAKTAVDSMACRQLKPIDLPGQQPAALLASEDDDEDRDDESEEF